MKAAIETALNQLLETSEALASEPYDGTGRSWSEAGDTRAAARKVYDGELDKLLYSLERRRELHRDALAKAETVRGWWLAAEPAEVHHLRHEVARLKLELEETQAMNEDMLPIDLSILYDAVVLQHRVAAPSEFRYKAILRLEARGLLAQNPPVYGWVATDDATELIEGLEVWHRLRWSSS